MSITVNWNLDEHPCGVFVDCNLRIDEYNSSHVFVATRVDESSGGSGSFAVDTGHWLKAYAISFNTPSYAWPAPNCGLLVHANNGDPSSEAIISRTCGDTAMWQGVVGSTNFEINAFSFIIGYDYTLIFVTISSTYLINFHTATAKFIASIAVAETVTLTYKYSITGGNWVENQTATIAASSDESATFDITGVTIADDIEIVITGISPTYSASSHYVYRPL